MVFTWTGGDGTNSNWSDLNNWKPTAPTGGPGAAHVAVIPKVDLTTVSNPVVDSSITVGWIRIEAGGHLTTKANTLTIGQSGGLALDSGGVLTISSGGRVILSPVWVDGREDRNVVDGTIFLEAPAQGNPAGILDMGLGFRTVLAGGGRILGKDPTALINVFKRFRSEIVIEGSLTIRSPDDNRAGRFENFGLVHATKYTSNANPPVVVPGNITLDWLMAVRGPGEWRVGAPPPSFADDGAQLTFGQNIEDANNRAPLSGDFKLFGNKLIIQSTVATSGHLYLYMGTIEVSAGKEFRAN